MKRTIIYLLGCCFLSALLLGCSQQDSTTEEVTTVEKAPAAEQTTTAVEEAPPALEPAVPVTENPDHEAMLASDDPQIAANKRLIYDTWRILLEAGHVEEANKYLDEIYIQHNPMVDTGRAGFVDFFSRIVEPREIADRVKRPVVAIVAERDLVALVTVDEQKNPNAEGETYTTTWFDMFRVKDGLITEHWDHGTLAPGMKVANYVPTKENLDHESSLASDDPQLAANKRRVYDMWRTVLDAQQVEEAPKFLARDYIQHNPMANTGLDGFLAFFRQFAQPKPVQEKVVNFIEIIAEGDLVVLGTVREYKDDNGDPYTTTWFDMFRVKDGLMVEHWDTARLMAMPPSPPSPPAE